MREMQATRVQFLGREAPLEKEVASHSSVFAWKIPWTEEPGVEYGPWGRKELAATERRTLLSFSLSPRHRSVILQHLKLFRGDHSCCSGPASGISVTVTFSW